MRKKSNSKYKVQHVSTFEFQNEDQYHVWLHIHRIILH